MCPVIFALLFVAEAGVAVTNIRFIVHKVRGMHSHRGYTGLIGGSAKESAVTQLSELKFRNAGKDVSLAHCSARGFDKDWAPANNTIDGNISTQWHTSGSDMLGFFHIGHIIISCPAPVEIDQFAFVTANFWYSTAGYGIRDRSPKSDPVQWSLFGMNGQCAYSPKSGYGCCKDHATNKCTNVKKELCKFEKGKELGCKRAKINNTWGNVPGTCDEKFLWCERESSWCGKGGDFVKKAAVKGWKCGGSWTLLHEQASRMKWLTWSNAFKKTAILGGSAVVDSSDVPTARSTQTPWYPVTNFTCPDLDGTKNLGNQGGINKDCRGWVTNGECKTQAFVHVTGAEAGKIGPSYKNDSWKFGDVYFQWGFCHKSCEAAGGMTTRTASKDCGQSCEKSCGQCLSSWTTSKDCGKSCFETTGVCLTKPRGQQEDQKNKKVSGIRDYLPSKCSCDATWTKANSPATEVGGCSRGCSQLLGAPPLSALSPTNGCSWQEGIMGVNSGKITCKPAATPAPLEEGMIKVVSVVIIFKNIDFEKLNANSLVKTQFVEALQSAFLSILGTGRRLTGYTVKDLTVELLPSAPNGVRATVKITPKAGSDTEALESKVKTEKSRLVAAALANAKAVSGMKDCLSAGKKPTDITATAKDPVVAQVAVQGPTKAPITASSSSPCSTLAFLTIICAAIAPHVWSQFAFAENKL